MEKSRIQKVIWLLFFLAISFSAAADKPLVLFDEGHAQTAGNADWVINGAFSDFADVFKSLGCEVRAVKQITAPNIKGGSILVLPEPNTFYSPDEEAAIVQFVEQGGGLYAIADHFKSDRNGDGVDSVAALNRFLPKLGLQIEQRYFNEAPVAGKYNQTPLTKGVKAVGVWGGSTVKCLSQNGVAHITVSDKNGGGAFIATNIVGAKGGKVVAMADSSPYDDGTGDSHDKLYNGFTKAGYNHDVLARNSIAWLLEKKTGGTPQEALTRLMADASNAFRRLNKGSDNELLMHYESSEKSIRELVLDNPELKGELKRRGSVDKAFSRLLQSLEVQTGFIQLHEN